NRIEGVGGGIYALAASALIAANRIVANRIGTERGGTGAGIAIAYGSPAIQVVGNEIERNRAGGPPSSRAGGAFGVAYWAQNRFVANFAYGSGGGLEGGGVLVRNLFSQNEASVAGGALFDGDALGNVFTQNKAFRSGGLELTGSTRAVV